MATRKKKSPWKKKFTLNACMTRTKKIRIFRKVK